MVLAVIVVLAGLTAFDRVWDRWTEGEDLSRWDIPLLTWLTQRRDPVLTGVLETAPLSPHRPR